MADLYSKQHRMQVALNYLYGLPPARTALEAYIIFDKAITEVEDTFLGKESYNPPSTFKDGTRTERMYMTFFESIYPISRYTGVHILVHKHEVTFISRFGAIEIQKKIHEDIGGHKRHFEDRQDLVIFEKKDAFGDGVWHEKNR